MNLKKITALAAAIIALPLHAAELSAQKGISILLVNGQAAEEKLGTNQVSDGVIQAVVKVDGKLGHGASAEIFESKPYVLTFEATGDEVKIKFPSLNSVAEARNAFDKAQPDWQVFVDGKEITVEQQMLKGKKGFMPYAGMEKLVAEHNKQRGIYFNNGELVDAPVAAEVAPVATSAVVTANAAAKTSVETPKVAAKNVEQLKAWYLKASKEERKEFRRWMIDQE
ncbi:DUF2057 domain-containing protein [Vibrio rhodolitus]|uniref:YccT family protein n=1 Tax=Vibrio rhodolitus TaxID=2231649 RepID=UPI000E0BEE14|nr:DUF2057 domain-containing protein [Vibrio rhodolitus]